MGYGTFIRPEVQAQPGKKRSRNPAVALILLAVLGLACFGMLHMSRKKSSAEPVKPKPLADRVKDLEPSVTPSTTLAIKSYVSSHVKSAAGLDSEAIKQLVIDHIQSAYKPFLNGPEWGQVFEGISSWGQYKDTFGAPWMGQLYKVADDQSTARVEQFKHKSDTGEHHVVATAPPKVIAPVHRAASHAAHVRREQKKPVVTHNSSHSQSAPHVTDQGGARSAGLDN